MCFSDLLIELKRQGINFTGQMVRWAIRHNKITRPQRDGGGRFVFGPENVEEIRKLAATPRKPGRQKKAA
jgi:hypothetical protein